LGRLSKTAHFGSKKLDTHLGAVALVPTLGERTYILSDRPMSEEEWIMQRTVMEPKRAPKPIDSLAEDEQKPQTSSQVVGLIESSSLGIGLSAPRPSGATIASCLPSQTWGLQSLR
jgi:hypothetical protein